MIARGAKKAASEPKSMKLPKRSFFSSQVMLSGLVTSFSIPLIGTGMAMPEEGEAREMESFS